MKKLFRLLTCAVAGLAAVAFTGCNKDKNEPASEIIIAGDASVAVTKAGGPQTITFSANYDWTAGKILTPTGDWCTITPTSGKAGTACTISVTISANSTETAREAIVMITTVKESSTQQPKGVKFTQAANTDPKDVTVKMDDTYSVIFHDRNMGAPKAGDLGTYFTYNEALKACPSGYHLVTATEWTDLAYNYIPFGETASDLNKSVLKIPITGGYYDKTELKSDKYGYYWVDGTEYGITDNDADVYAANTNDTGLGYLIPPSYPDYSRTWKMQVRCVKDAMPQ